jgi:hypothetical protein
MATSMVRVDITTTKRLLGPPACGALVHLCALR